MEDVRRVLRYKRETECWICDGCETENPMAFGKCALCGDIRGPSCVILDNWETEERKAAMRAEAERRAAAARRTATTSYGYKKPEKIFRDDDDSVYEYDEEKSTGWVALAFIGIFIFIMLCVALANA